VHTRHMEDSNPALNNNLVADCGNSLSIHRHSSVASSSIAAAMSSGRWDMVEVP
jgi:hypothetical protein